jgi:signal peptidase I
VRRAKDGGSGDRRHPWRENLETLSVAIVMALALKVFVVEAYKIPTGSMQPTLMGSDEVRIYDRILVDKLTYLFRDPRRWEVVVFRYPLDLSVNYIKRIVGVGPEWIRIERGDLWRRSTEQDEWEILRKPRSVQESLWKAVYEGPREGEEPFATWLREGGRWRRDGDRLVVAGEGILRYALTVRDAYTDGYPSGIKERLRPRQAATEEVGDLRISFDVEPDAGCEGVFVELGSGKDRYQAFLPGPAADPSERARIARNGEARPLDASVRLRAGESVRVSFSHADASLEVRLDGDPLGDPLEWAEDPDADFGRGNRVAFGTKGGGAAFEDVVLQRDVHYTNRHGVTWEKIPDGNYFMLGDNTQDSADSRLWVSIAYDLDPPVEELTRIQGNSRDRRATDANPRFLSRDPSVQIFRDLYGEQYLVPRSSIHGSSPPTPEPLVRREYVLGKALVVFWPFPPFAPIFRWKLIR